MCITHAFYVEGENEPVTVYKVIERHTVTKENVWLPEVMITRKTPFRGVILSEDTINGTVPFVAKGESDIVGEFQADGKRYAKAVNGGFIHTYATKRSAIKDYFEFYRRECEKDKSVKVEIYECEIPAGEGYWGGMFDDNVFIKCTASKSIVFKRKLSPEEIHMAQY